MASSRTEIIRDKTAALLAVRKCGSELKRVSKDLQNDSEVALAALKQDVDNFWYASPNLQTNSDFLLAAVEQNGNAIHCAFQRISQHHPAYLTLALAAVKQTGMALLWLPHRLKKNREIVMAAEKQHGGA